MTTEHPFISACIPWITDWPFIRHHSAHDLCDARVLHAAVALAIKCSFDQADDDDTVWFWNVCRESRKPGRMGSYFTEDAVAMALGGLLIADPLVSRRAWNDAGPQAQKADAHYRLCSGMRLGVLSQLSWAIFLSRADERLQWLLVRAYRSQKRHYSVLDAATRWWENKIRRKYPNLMGDVFARYYGAAHVFSQWTQGRL